MTFLPVVQTEVGVIFSFALATIMTEMQAPVAPGDVDTGTYSARCPSNLNKT